MSKSQEKWPTFFKVTRISSSILMQELTLYFVVAVTNKEQLLELKDHMQMLAEFEIDDDRVTASSILNHEQIIHLAQVYEPLAKSWRGQWYALANAVVDGCSEAFK